MYPSKPQFYYIKAGNKGVKIIDMFTYWEVTKYDSMFTMAENHPGVL